MANIITSPSKYIQGKGELSRLAQYVAPLGSKALVLISASGLKRSGEVIRHSFSDQGRNRSDRCRRERVQDEPPVDSCGTNPPRGAMDRGTCRTPK